MAKRGRSAAALKALRKKFKLGEFKKKPKRTTIRKRPYKKPSRRIGRRKNRLGGFGPDRLGGQLYNEFLLDLKEGRQR